MDPIDHQWGSVVDKETNSFNGMIGMIQRKVTTNYVCTVRGSEFFALFTRRQPWLWVLSHKQAFVKQQ